MNGFKTLHIKSWQQFENVTIDFHSRMTILTGANGSGKTTLLNILAKHFQWEISNLATPRKNISTQIMEWFNNWLGSDNVVGELTYTDGKKTSIVANDSGHAQYSLSIKERQSVEGFYIPSHRSVFRYESVDQLQMRQTFKKEDAFTKVSNSARNRYSGGGDRSSSYYIKEVLISWSIFGHGNPDMVGDGLLLENFHGFEAVLKTVLPASLGFQKIEIRNFEIVLLCDTGEFLIDAVSGGVGTLIDLAWQIYMFSTDKRTNFVVLIDEAENHLHPIMQRRFLHDLLEAFPNVSFIVSTHSPLIVSSVKDSRVVALRYKNNKVFSETLDLIHEPRTATEILDEILGVSFTMPLWAEEKLTEITSKYFKKDALKKEDLIALRNELKEAGLEKLMPEAVSKVADSYD